MQTFLPYPEYRKSMIVLDGSRLRKQAVECKQILMVHLGQTDAYANHPAVLMWTGYVPSLFAYMKTCMVEIERRGFSHELLTKWCNTEHDKNVGPGLWDQTPPWLGDDDLHRSHRSNLLRKDFALYSERFSKHGEKLDPPDLTYIWPEPLSPTTYTVRLSKPDIKRINTGERTLPRGLPADLGSLGPDRQPPREIRSRHL